MSCYPSSINDLVEQFSKLPGVGKKTAERLALHILRTPRREAERLSRSILNVKDKVQLCRRCFGLSDAEICTVCSNPSRNTALICVVENVAEMVAIERSGGFGGLYHILQGVLSPMDGIGPDDIRIRELLERAGEGGVEEVILATGTRIEGETTASFIAGQLERFSVKVTRIASGVPVGGELRYLDQITLQKAMETRHVICKP